MCCTDNSEKHLLDNSTSSVWLKAKIAQIHVLYYGFSKKIQSELIDGSVILKYPIQTN